jgi:hypothetical protein
MKSFKFPPNVFDNFAQISASERFNFKPLTKIGRILRARARKIVEVENF